MQVVRRFALRAGLRRVELLSARHRVGLVFEIVVPVAFGRVDTPSDYGALVDPGLAVEDVLDGETRHFCWLLLMAL